MCSKLLLNIYSNAFKLLKHNAHTKTVEMLDRVTNVGLDLKSELNEHVESLRNHATTFIFTWTLRYLTKNNIRNRFMVWKRILYDLEDYKAGVCLVARTVSRAEQRSLLKSFKCWLSLVVYLRRSSIQLFRSVRHPCVSIHPLLSNLISNTTLTIDLNRIVLCNVLRTLSKYFEHSLLRRVSKAFLILRALNEKHKDIIFGLEVLFKVVKRKLQHHERSYLYKWIEFTKTERDNAKGKAIATAILRRLVIRKISLKEGRVFANWMKHTQRRRLSMAKIVKCVKRAGQCTKFFF